MPKNKTLKPVTPPGIDAVCRRADELGLTYGKYVSSEQYIIDTADGGYFHKKRGKKVAHRKGN